jgi:hypothetical protein
MLKLEPILTADDAIIYSISLISSGVLVGHMFACRICGSLRVVETHDAARARCTCSSADNHPSTSQLEQLPLLLDQGR